MRFVSLIFVTVMACVLPGFAETIALTNGRVLTAGEAGALENATVIIEGHQITGVGADVDIPAHARIIDVSGKTLTPGLIVASTTLGAVEINDRANANDIESRSSSYGAGADIQYAINPNSSLIPVARSGGVSGAVVMPGLNAKTGGAIGFGGQAAFISTAEDVRPVTQAQVAVTLNLLGSTQGRAAVYPQLAAVFKDAAAFAEDPNPKTASSYKAVKWSAADLQALVPVMRGEAPLIVAVDRASDILTLLEIVGPYDIAVVLEGAAEAWTVAEEIAAADIAVILDPYENLPRTFNAVFASQQNATRLHDAGVRLLVVPPLSGHDERLVRYRAGVAAAAGLPNNIALEAITSGPAKVFGLTDYGQIAPGKVADIAVWSGDPFEPLSELEAFYIAGAPQPLENRQTALRQKYRSDRVSAGTK